MNTVTLGFPNPSRYGKAITLGVALLAVLYVAFRKYRNDRVILCEAVGVSIFAVGFVVGIATGFSGSFIWRFAVCGAAAVLCGCLAVYFSVVNGMRRKRVRTRGK